MNVKERLKNLTNKFKKQVKIDTKSVERAKKYTEAVKKMAKTD